MKTLINDITPALSAFVPLIVNIACTTIEANTLGRELTDREIDRLLIQADTSVRDFLKNIGKDPDQEEDIREEMKLTIFENASALMYMVIDEMKKRMQK